MSMPPPPPQVRVLWTSDPPKWLLNSEFPRPVVGLGVLGVERETCPRGAAAPGRPRQSPPPSPPLSFCAGPWLGPGATGRTEIWGGATGQRVLPAPMRLPSGAGGLTTDQYSGQGLLGGTAVGQEVRQGVAGDQQGPGAEGGGGGHGGRPADGPRAARHRNDGWHRDVPGGGGWGGLASQPRRYRVPGQPLLNRHQVGGVSRSPDGLFAQQEREPIRGRPAVSGNRTYGGRPGQRVEEQGTWASQKHSEAGYGRPVDRGVWTAKTVKRPRQQPAQPPIRQLLGAANTQTAHPATSSTAPTHQLLGSANAETTPAGAPAAAAGRTQ